MILSASQIESFDNNTTFGCKAKWWFERVDPLRVEVPKDGALLIGDAVHQTLEAFLKGAGQGVLHDIVIGAPGALEFLIALRKRVKVVEHEFQGKELILAGVPIRGKIDWITFDEDAKDCQFTLGDHKTTSVIAKYSKTPGQLRASVQMNIYAAWLERNLVPFEQLRMAQDFYQTKGAKKFSLVECELSKPDHDSRILEVEATIEEMVKASHVTDPATLAPNLKACHIGYGCPHRAHCPHLTKGVFDMSSLLDAFKSVLPAAPPPSVLPTDAPKSDPVAAKPLVIDDSENPTGDKVAPKVEVPAPKVEVPAPKIEKKRGRPLGSSNKHASQEEIAQMQGVAVVPSIGSLGPIKITKITIRHEAKIGLPNYSSAGACVEMEAEVLGDAEAAHKSLSLQVKAAMVKELEVYAQDAKTKAGLP